MKLQTNVYSSDKYGNKDMVGDLLVVPSENKMAEEDTLVEPCGKELVLTGRDGSLMEVPSANMDAVVTAGQST